MSTITKYFQVPDLVRYASAVGITSASSVLLGGVLLNILFVSLVRGNKHTCILQLDAINSKPIF